MLRALEARLDAPAGAPPAPLGAFAKPSPFYCFAAPAAEPPIEPAAEPSPLSRGRTVADCLPAPAVAVPSLLLALRKALRCLAHAHRRGSAHGGLSARSIRIETSGEVAVDGWKPRERKLDGPKALRSARVPLREADGFQDADGGREGAVGVRDDVFAVGCLLNAILGRETDLPASPCASATTSHKTDGLTSAPPSSPPASPSPPSSPPPAFGIRGDLAGTLAPEALAALERLTRRCLDPQPARRPASAAEILDALEDL
jgi:serine/threonine protein kinase